MSLNHLLTDLESGRREPQAGAGQANGPSLLRFGVDNIR